MIEAYKERQLYFSEKVLPLSLWVSHPTKVMSSLNARSLLTTYARSKVICASSVNR